jgi:hypothetical protein
VIYPTSHDVEGFENERLFTFFLNNSVADGEKRMKLAFACLLTAVGLPMILAGDEFADRHDLFDARGQSPRAAASRSIRSTSPASARTGANESGRRRRA